MAGNFCAVTGAGANCNFVSLDACYQFLRTFPGQCVADPSALPQPAPPTYAPTRTQPQPMPQIAPPRINVLDNMRQSMEMGEMGRRQAQERKEYESRMAAPTPRADQDNPWQVAAWVMEAYQGKRRVAYDCQGEKTTLPKPGCVVVGYAEAINP